MRTSFHHQPDAQHTNFQLPISWQADYPIFRGEADIVAGSNCSGLLQGCPPPMLRSSTRQEPATFDKLEIPAEHQPAPDDRIAGEVGRRTVEPEVMATLRHIGWIK